jgi:act minimal PKS acyl carrier protein
MQTLTIDGLREIMRGVAGVDEAVDLDGDIVETTFTDLGYDSLAVLEVTAQIRRQHGLRVPDDAVGTLPTPGAMLAYVNANADAVS